MVTLASIIVRGLDPSVKQRIADQAAESGRSMEAEVRRILTREASKPHIGLALLEASRSVEGIEDLPVPTRSDQARVADFG